MLFTFPNLNIQLDHIPKIRPWKGFNQKSRILLYTTFHISNYVNYSLYFILFPGHYQDRQQVEDYPSNQQDCYWYPGRRDVAVIDEDNPKHFPDLF